MKSRFFESQPSEQKIKDTKRSCVENLKSKADEFIDNNIGAYLKEAREKGLQPYQEKEFIEKLKRKTENSIQREYLDLAAEIDKCFKP